MDKARVDSQNHRFTYDEPMKVESVAQSICDMALNFGDGKKGGNPMSRPFGVALLLAGVDKTGTIALLYIISMQTWNLWLPPNIQSHLRSFRSSLLPPSPLFPFMWSLLSIRSLLVPHWSYRYLRSLWGQGYWIRIRRSTEIPRGWVVQGKTNIHSLDHSLDHSLYLEAIFSLFLLYFTPNLQSNCNINPTL